MPVTGLAAEGPGGFFGQPITLPLPCGLSYDRPEPGGVPGKRGEGEVRQMYSQLSRLADERRRDMLADAKRERPAWLQLALVRASRRADRAERRMRQAYRAAARRRAEL
jgi:hypothetical protein